MTRLYTTILLLFTFLISDSQDILRTYNPSTNKLNYRSPTALYYMARFDLPAPGFVSKIDLMLDGTGSGTLNLFGHEGGTAFGEVRKELISAVPFTKSENGRSTLQVQLPEKVWLDNKQFFVVINITGSDLFLVRDSEAKQPTCSSTDGGTFVPTVIAIPGNHNFYPHLWQVLNTPLVVDVHIEYPIKESPTYFQNVTEAMGFPANMSARTMAWADYDGDGYQDLLVRGRLFRNINGDSFVNVTQEKGLVGNARGNCFVDMNNDGLWDIILFHTENHLYINKGDGTFEHSILDIPAFPSLSSFSFADINGDGYLDLFVGQLWGAYPVPLPNYLFFNDGKNGFKDESKRLYPEHDGVNNFPSGIVCDPGNSSTFTPNRNQNRRSRGSQFVDYDNDGDLDLYVTNYFLERDELFQNDGNGNFTNVISQTKLDLNEGGGSSHGTGVDWADYDNDGDMDLLLPQLAHPWGVQRLNHSGTILYNNQGAPNFDFAALHEAESGIAYEETHAGATWGDVNNDGLQDFIITTYYGCRYINLYLQNADHSFQNGTFEFGLDRIASGEDAVFVDFNNDGLLDLCVGEGNNFRIYRNTQNKLSGKWVQLDLRAKNANYFAIGAKVEVKAGGQTFTQEVNLGRGQRMQRPARLFFGLGNVSAIEDIIVHWPDGKNESFGKFRTNKIYTLEEGGIAIGKDKPKDFTIYPNPTTGQIQMDFLADEITVVDASGKKVLIATNVDEVFLDKTKFQCGVYILKIKAEGKTEHRKVILQ